jgi:hypothetical protein
MHGHTLPSATGLDAPDARPDRPTDRHERGPHALVALAAFAALVAGALVVVLLLVSAARLLERAL